MKIDLIIASHANPSGVQKLFESLLHIDLGDIQKIYLILNPPDTQTQELLSAQFSNKLPLEILNSENKGVNVARNLGAQRAQAEILFFLDDDEVIHDPQLFKKHLAKHLAKPDLIGLGGLYELARPTGLWSRAYHQIQTDWLISGEALDGSNYHLLGGHISFKRKIFAQHQFEEEIIFGGAETEFLLRLQGLGFQCRLQLDWSILHAHNINFASFVKKAFRQGRSHRKYSFIDLDTLRRKLLLPEQFKSEKGVAIWVAMKLYSLAFNLGRNNVKGIRLPRLSLKDSFTFLRRQIFWLTLKIDFLAKKIDKSRPPDT